MAVLLLVITLLSRIVLSTVYTVKPDGMDEGQYSEHTHTLNEFLSGINSNTTLHFLPGQYHMFSNFTIQNVGNIHLKGNKTIINCSPLVGISLINITKLTVECIAFVNCGRDYSQHSVANIYQQIENYLFNNTWNIAIFVHNCHRVNVSNITIYLTTGTHGVLGLNLMNTSNLSDIKIIVKPGNKSVLTKGGIFYHHVKTSNTSITINNFQYVVIGQQVSASLVLEIIFLHTSHTVEITIQNTKFINLRNSIALFYYTGSCNSTARTALLLNNIIVKNNSLSTAVDKHALFYIILKGRGFIFTTKPTRGYRHNVHINNSIIEVNSDIDTIFNIKLKETLLTMVNISVYNCTVFNNTNSELLMTESEVENFWQLTHNVILSYTNISHNNSTMGGDHLISFENGKIMFEDGVIIQGNSYYESIIKLHLCVLWFHGRVTFSNNVAYRLFKTVRNSYFVLEENVKVEILNNNFHNVLKIADWEEDLLLTHPSLKQVCQIQFYSSKGNLDKEFEKGNLNYSIVVMDNLLEQPNFLYASELNLTFNRTCEWLSDKSFKTIKSTSVFGKFLHINSSVHVKVKSNSIPSKICQCSSNQVNDCDTRVLGSVFPGQTLIVKLTVPSLAAHSTLKVVTLNNLVEEICVIDNFSELYQQQSNLTCSEYTYTIKHHNPSLGKCELYLSTQQHDTETFYVWLKTCPPGFVLKDKMCSCDPVLQSRFPGVHSCNLNTGTILRPGRSWITVANNDSSNYTYRVTLSCPFDYCLPHSSNLDLNYPDSQCQFYRTGFLCGQCKEGLSAVFGSAQCKKCSNLYLFLIIPGIITAIILVAMLFIFNLTVTKGAINTFIFYIDIISINNTLYYHSQSAFIVFPSMFEFCFYNGMTGYVKIWIYLSYPALLGMIAFAIVIGSRYSTIVQRLTAQRALSVLATLFVLTYTGVIRAVSTVLYSYTTITDLPTNQTNIVWSVDASAHMHSEHIVLYIVSTAFIITILTFSGVLLFARPLLRFKVISTFKPLLDIYFGPYKDSAYFWVGLQLLVRWLIFNSTMLDQNTTLTISCILIGLLLCLQGIMQPFKNKYLNVQESLMLYNILAVNVVTLYDQKRSGIGVIASQVLIFAALLYFTILLVVYCILQLCGKSINHQRRLLVVAWKKKTTCQKSIANTIEMDSLRNSVPNVTYNYREFQEPLIGLDD